MSEVKGIESVNSVRESIVRSESRRAKLRSTH